MLYSLYGIVEHSGGMHGGHYTAYVRVRQPVRHKQSREETAQSEVLTDAAKVPLGPASTATSSTQPETRATAVDGATCSGCSPEEIHRTFDLTSKRSQWYYISDTHVKTATENEVVKSQAYIMFYERVAINQ